mgnify:CR=1 FL=1
MPYTPRTWVAGVAPGFDATHMNEIETGIDLAVGHAEGDSNPHSRTTWIQLNGTLGGTIDYAASGTVLSIAGDPDIRIKMRADDYTPATDMILAAF